MPSLLSLAYLLIFACCLSSCGNINPPSQSGKVEASKLPLDQLKRPPGFSIALFATNVTNARSLEWTPAGTLFVSTRSAGKVYALRDMDDDHRADQMYTIAEGLQMPNGVAFKDGDLYVAEVSRLLRYRDIEQHLDNPPEPEVIYDNYPTDTHHGWKYIAFGPDSMLYIPVGAPCNICDSKEDIYASITRINPDGTGREIVQHGVRNTVGFDWHPVTGELWFTDNGRDWMGDDLPPCELNRAPRDSMHFGYPYCHGAAIADPEFGRGKDCADYTPPVQELKAHVAPLGMEFYTGSMFPTTYLHQPFIAEHGSWNRSKKSGYQISLVRLQDGQSTSYEPFISGWLDEATDEVWGRPVDLELLPDGSMLISDDYADVIYRVTYQQ